MINSLTIDLSKFGRTLRGVNVVIDDVNRKVLVPITTEVATRVFGDAGLLRNVIKDSIASVAAEEILTNVSSFNTLEDIEERLIAATNPVIVYFLKEL